MKSPLSPTLLREAGRVGGIGRCLHALAAANSQTRVSIVMLLAITEAMGLNRKQFSTRLRIASQTRIAVPYSLFSPKGRQLV
jgi:hypothetical protein